MTTRRTTGERLGVLLDELGLERVHLALGAFSEPQVGELLGAQPDRVASLTCIVPYELDPNLLRPHAGRLVGIFGSTGNPAQDRLQSGMASWEGIRTVALPSDYAAELWSDVVRDHVRPILEGIRGAADRVPAVVSVNLEPREGVHDGIRYRVDGAGPPLVLFPVGIAPTQWDAALAELNRAFTTVRVGGAEIGFVRLLESRAATSYLQGVRALFDLLEIKPGARILEVGTGSGALVRELARITRGQNEIVAVDINGFLLDEARALAEMEGLGSRIEFRAGNAEQLPFQESAFDVVFTATLLEECDADRAIGEVHRVLKPGGRAGVAVRSIDLPTAFSIELSAELARKLFTPQLTPVTARGCADASLYRRFATRFSNLQPHPFWAAIPVPPGQPPPPLDSRLSPAESDALSRAWEEAQAAGTLTMLMPHHGVTGIRI